MPARGPVLLPAAALAGLLPAGAPVSLLAVRW
ncbi:sulfurtransferase, partial [Mycobacterium tuberculosis]